MHQAVEKWEGRVFLVLLLACFVFVVPWFPDGAAVKWGAIAAVPLLLVRVFRFDLTDAIAAALVAYAGLSIAWSPDPQFGVIRIIQCALIWCVFTYARRHWELVPVACAIGILVTTAMWFWVPFGGFTNENFQTEFLILALPLAWTAGRIGKIAAVVAGFALALNGSVIEYAALIALATVAIFALARGGALNLIIALCIAGLIGATMAFAIDWDSGRIVYRLHLWAVALQMWADAPLLGHGLGSYLYLYPDYTGSAEIGASPADSLSLYVDTAHNDGLQLLSELGLVGVGLAGLLLSRVRLNYGVWEIAALFAATICMVGAPVQTPATAVLIACILGRLMPVGRTIWFVAAPAFLASAAAAMWLTVITVASQYHFASAVSLFDEYPNASFVELAKANSLNPYDPRIRMQLFISLMRVQGEFNSTTADMFYRLSRTASPNEPALQVARLQYITRHGICDAECETLARNLACVHRQRIGEMNHLFPEQAEWRCPHT